MPRRACRFAFHLTALVALALCGPVVSAAGRAAPRPVDAAGRVLAVRALLPGLGPAQAQRLERLGFLFERDPGGRVIAWLSAEEQRKLAALGIGWQPFPDPPPPAPGSGAAATYHDHAQLTAALQQVAADHPQITRLVSAGPSVQGRELWWLEITDQPGVEQDEPGFKYVSTMHGDEPVGTEMLLRLIDWLTDGYGVDPRATRLVDEVEIWIMPMMNPDGNALSQRFNADGVDLNRDFPDQFDDPNDDPTGRARETQLVMDWQAAHSTALSINFHTGALVTNYPYDNTPSGASVYSACPDDDVVIDLSLNYSENNPPMYASSSFPQGITNGADWYAISGGMQDWNYVYRGDIELTVELSNVKWPAASQLDGLWQDNRESMIAYLERALTGVRGRVTDAGSGAPLAATLRVTGRDVPFYSDPAAGDYHRSLPAGSFTLEASAAGYQPASAQVDIADPRADAQRLDFALQPLPTRLEHVAHRVTADDGGDGFLDPGESGRLAVTLNNAGRGATGISGPLLPLTPWADTAGAGTWPDLAAGQSGESLPPHPQVSVLPGAPAGHKLGFAVQWSADSGVAGKTDAFFVPLGAPATDRYPAADVPLPIGDNSTVESHLSVAGDVEIDECNVRVDLTHSYIGDLTLSLVAPDGTTVRLHDQGGGSANDIHTWYDTQTPSVDDLGVLAGKSAAGTWTLRVTDNASGDQGSLDGWTLELLTRAFEDPVAEVLLRSMNHDAAGTHLEWWPVGSANSYRVYRSEDPSSEAAFLDATSEDADASDTRFVDADSRPFLCWLVSGEGHTGEGLWGHFGR